jgi:hypothetical protein
LSVGATLSTWLSDAIYRFIPVATRASAFCRRHVTRRRGQEPLDGAFDSD